MKKLLHFAFLLISICCLHFKTSAAIQVVSVANYQFTPTSFNIFLGDTVMFVWSNGNHTTTSTSVPAGALGWNSPMNSTTDTFIYIPAVTGTYNFHCGIHASMTGQFTVSSCVAPDYSNAIALNISACDSPFIMDATNPIATNYQWIFNSNLISGATNATYMATNPGTYATIVSNSCGTDTTPTNGLTFLTEPTIVIEASNDTICMGQTLTLAGTGGLTYTWSPNVFPINFNGDTALANPTTSFEVVLQGTSFNGCSNTDSIFITVISIPQADFLVTQNGTTITIVNNTSGATVYDWDFGDGFTTNNPAPSHTYATTGVFTIQLIATNANGCSDTITQTIDLADGIFSVADEQINFSYSTETKELFVSGSQHSMYTVTLYDLSGRKMLSESIVNAKIISLQPVTPGIYFAEAAVGNQRKTIRIIVN